MSLTTYTPAQIEAKLADIKRNFNYGNVTQYTGATFETVAEATAFWTSENAASRTPIDSQEIYIKSLKQIYKWNGTLVAKCEFSRALSELETIALDPLNNDKTVSGKMVAEYVDLQITTETTARETQLKNLIGGETTTPISLSFTNGAILSVDGTEFTTAAQKRTGLLPLNGADVLTYYGMRSFEGATYSLLALYDENDDFVASVVNGTTDGSIKSGNLQVKELYPTATQFRLACNSNPSFIALITASTTVVIVGSVPQIEENVETNTTNIQKNTVLVDKFKKQIFKHRLPIESLITPTESNAKTLANLYESTLTGSPRVLNTIFRTSIQVAVGTSTFPSDRYFNIVTPRKLGYTIEFLLNGRYLEVAGRERSYAFNLEVDGVVVCKNYIPTITTYDSNGKTWIKFDLGEVKTNAHIKLYWFNGFGGVATDGSISTYSEDRLKLNFDSDSIGEGARSGTGGNISDVAGSVFSSYIGIVARTFNLDLYNAGVGGSGFTALGNNSEPNMVDRFDTYISPYDCDIFMFSAGLNDGYITYGSEDETAVIAYYAKVSARFSNTKTKVICISPFDPLTSPKTNNLGIRGIRDLQKTLSVQYGFPFIDIIDGITYDELGNVIMDSSATIGGIFDNGRKNATNFDVSDQTHPNATGYLYFGKRVVNEIIRVLNNVIIS